MEALPYLDRLPPLVDRRVFFGDPAIANAQLSPDGRFLSFVRDLDGVLNLWVKGLEEPWEAARPLSDDRERPVTGYFWSRDGRYVLFVQDQAGNENFRIYAVDPTAGPAEGARTSPARDLTPFSDVQARVIALPENAPERILIGLNNRDQRLHDVYRLELATGRRTLVFRNREEQNVAGWTADLEGHLRLGVRMLADGSTELLRVDRERLEVILRCGFEESCEPIRFHPDGRRVYLSTNHGADVDLARLVLLDPETGSWEEVSSDPEEEADFGGAVFSRRTHELLATRYVGARARLYAAKPEFAHDLERVRALLPEGDLQFRSPTRDDRLWIVKVVLDRDNGPNYLFDRETGEVRLLYRPQPAIPVDRLAEMRSVRYRTRDGEEIPAYLTLPPEVEPRGLATVLFPHGGPWARDEWGWSDVAQFLANRGYAVLQPNFRGSTGFGKRFLNLGNWEWGTGAMQHDLTDGVRWLVEEGIADPERVAILGGSYGGYAALAGVAFTPDLYAAGVSVVGPSSILTLIDSIPPYWEPIRAIFTRRVGDPDDQEQKRRLEAQSPLYSADRIRAPLLIIQGANDPRVKKAESDQIVAALRDLGRTVEYLVAPDEGHGFAREVNNLAAFAAIERFLARHLGGRFQEEMPEGVAGRLRELTVDPAEVEVPSSGIARRAGRRAEAAAG